jgi:formamidopyrimidine-DNA glycosylase
MPELPEVETVMRGLIPVLVGHSIAGVELRRSGLRFPFPVDFAARLKGRQILGLTRRAKYILVNLDDGHTLLVHLGMTGRFTVLGENTRPNNLGEFYFEQGATGAGSGPHDHVVITLKNGVQVVYTDYRRFGVMDLLHESELASHRLLKDIGVEPLGNEFSADFLAGRFRKKSAPLKAALLDQRIIAGLGNIYVNEVLYRSGLSPKRKAGTLVRKNAHDGRLDELVRHVRDVLKEAISAGGSTLRDFSGTDGSEGAFQQRFSVYDRAGEKCQTPGCRGTIRRIVQSGRSTFFCPSCQK